MSLPEGCVFTAANFAPVEGGYVAALYVPTRYKVWKKVRAGSTVHADFRDAMREAEILMGKLHSAIARYLETVGVEPVEEAPVEAPQGAE